MLTLVFTVLAIRFRVVPVSLAQGTSRHQFVRDLSRAVALDHGLRLGVVGVLQHRPLAKPLTPDDDRYRARRAALLGVNGAGRHQIDLALGAGRESSPQLGS